MMMKFEELLIYDKEDKCNYDPFKINFKNLDSLLKLRLYKLLPTEKLKYFMSTSFGDLKYLQKDLEFEDVYDLKFTGRIVKNNELRSFSTITCQESDAPKINENSLVKIRRSLILKNVYYDDINILLDSCKFQFNSLCIQDSELTLEQLKSLRSPRLRKVEISNLQLSTDHLNPSELFTSELTLECLLNTFDVEYIIINQPELPPDWERILCQTKLKECNLLSLIFKSSPYLFKDTFKHPELLYNYILNQRPSFRLSIRLCWTWLGSNDFPLLENQATPGDDDGFLNYFCKVPRTSMYDGRTITVTNRYNNSQVYKLRIADIRRPTFTIFSVIKHIKNFLFK